MGATLTCASCGQENREQARFCVRCGVRLPQPLGWDGREGPADARFCDLCGAPATFVPTRVAGRKVVSVVFGDLVGSTALQEVLDPESSRRLMARFYDAMRTTVSRHGGRLEKFLGDGVVAVFGVPVVSEDDAVRATRCAADMIAAVATLGDEWELHWGVRLRMRVGVNTGELVVSGDGELVGDAMNTAARLQEAGGPGDVLIGEATWRLVRHGVKLAPVPAMALKGKAAPVRAWRLLATELGPEGPDEGSLEASFVGRSGELSRLGAVFAEAVEARSSRLATVIGSPGIGKTRLAAEFTARLPSEVTVLHGRCEPIGRGLTFLPVAHVLREAGGITDTDPAEAVRAKLHELVAGDPESDRIVALTSSLLGAGEPAAAEETFWGVRRVLEALARRRPLVVIFDDVHWGQPTFLDLVEHLAEWVRDAPLLLVLLSRPELRDLRDGLTGRDGHASAVIELAPLGPDESHAFIQGLFGRVELPSGLLSRVVDTTEGNPLFLGETLRMLVDDGVLNERGEVRESAGEWAVEVPPTIQALLSARIERLHFEERNVLQRAAVIGKQFDRGALAELVGPQSEIDAQLDALRRKELVESAGTYWVDESGYRFQNMLIRDAAYGSLLKETRAELHERFAYWLLAKAADRIGDHEVVIAYHLEQAHRYLRELGSPDDRVDALGRRAASMLHSAGRRALARADLPAASALLLRALDRLETDTPDLLWDLADAQLCAGESAAVSKTIARFAAVAGEDGRLRARAEVLSGHLAVLTGDAAPDTAVEILARAADVLAAEGDSAGAAEAHHVIARRHRQQGRFGAAEAALDQALAAARRAGDQRKVTAVLAAGPRTTVWGPTNVPRATGRCLDALRIMRLTPGNRHVEPIAQRCQAVLEAMRGRFEAAREGLAAARGSLRELGHTVELQELTTFAGIVELLAGDPAAAESHLRQAHEKFSSLGFGVPAARAGALLARALLEQGREDEALAQTRYAERHAAGDLKATITWCGVRAEVLARRGDHAAGLALADRAVGLTEPTDALADKADAEMALARVLLVTGRPDEASSAVERARALYGAKGHTVGVGWTEEFTVTPGPTRQRLAAALAALGDRAPGRFVAELIRRWATGDPDAVIELYAEDVRLVDHSRNGWGELCGLEQARGLVGQVMAAMPDSPLAVTEKLDGDERVLAFTGILPGSPGAAADLSMGFVIVVESGLLVEEHIYDPDDHQEMHAQYARLDGHPATLAHRPPERAVAAFCRPWSAGDLDELVELLPPDIVAVGHGGHRWEARGRDTLRAAYGSALDKFRYVHIRPAEVLACDDRVLAVRATVNGLGRDGHEEFSAVINYVVVVEAGRIRRLEQFGRDDGAAALARYGALGGNYDGLGKRVPERLVAEVLRRLAAGENLRELYRADFDMVDHRRLGWEELSGPQAAADLLRSLFGMVTEMGLAVDEVIACDDRVMAVTVTVHGTAREGGGALTLPLGYVILVEDNRLGHAEIYEPEDRLAMVARYAALGGGQGPLGDRPPERVWAEYVRLAAARDLDRLAGLLAPDWVLIDHRTLGWQEFRGHDGALGRIRSGYAVAADVRLEVDEVLACDDRVIAMRATVHGTRSSGRRPFDLPAGIVSVVENGRIIRREQFDHADVEGMLTRYAELGGHREP